MQYIKYRIQAWLVDVKENCLSAGLFLLKNFNPGHDAEFDGQSKMI